MKPAQKTPGTAPWRTNSFADGTARGVVPGQPDQSALELCASVVDACAARRLASPAFENYFAADPMRPSGMVLAEKPGQNDHRDDQPSDLEGVLEIDGGGNVRLR